MKAKSIIINGEIHYKFKMLCKGKNMKIGALMEDLVLLYLDNPKQVQNQIDEMKESK